MKKAVLFIILLIMVISIFTACKEEINYDDTIVFGTGTTTTTTVTTTTTAASTTESTEPSTSSTLDSSEPIPDSEPKEDLKEEVQNSLKGLKWCALGDSITATSTLGAEKNYPLQIAEANECDVTVLGYGGTGYLKDVPFCNRIGSIPADTEVLTVFGSFNDLFVEWDLGELGDNTNDTLYGAFQYFIDTVYATHPNIVIGIILPTPWGSANPNTSYKQDLREQYLKALTDVAEYNGLPILDLYNGSGMTPWNKDFMAENYLNGDGVHPTSEAHAEYITPMVTDFLKSLIK